MPLPRVFVQIIANLIPAQQGTAPVPPASSPESPLRAPQQHTLETIWGHETQKTFLLRLLSQGRLRGPILLEGQDAVGKRSFALAAAKVILSASKRHDGGSISAPAPPPFAKKVPPSEDDDLFGGQDDLFAAEELSLFPEDPAPPPATESDPAVAPWEEPVPATPAAPEPLAVPEPRATAFPFRGYDDHTCRRVEASYPPAFDADGRPTTLGHPDLTTLEPPGNSRSILVSQIQALHDIVSLPPIQCEFRLVIILGVDTITQQAANSMLKLLEEPPSYLRFILVTDRPHRVLRTIISRCTRVPFFPMAKEEIMDRLISEERLAPELARVAASLCEGRPGVALRILSDALLERRRGVFEARLSVERFGALAVPGAASRALASGKTIGDTAQLLIAYLRDRLVARHAPGRPELLVNGDIRELLEAGNATSAQLSEELERLLHLLDGAQHPYLPNTQAALETALWPGDGNG